MLPPNRIESNQKSLDIKTGVAIVAVVQVENVSYYHRSEDHVNVVNASQAEIGQLDLASRRDQHVLRFEVSVNDTIGVQEINSTQNLVHQVLHSRNKFTLNQSNKQRVKSPSKKIFKQNTKQERGNEPWFDQLRVQVTGTVPGKRPDPDPRVQRPCRGSVAVRVRAAGRGKCPTTCSPKKERGSQMKNQIKWLSNLARLSQVLFSTLVVWHD